MSCSTNSCPSQPTCQHSTQHPELMHRPDTSIASSLIGEKCGLDIQSLGFAVVHPLNFKPNGNRHHLYAIDAQNHVSGHMLYMSTSLLVTNIVSSNQRELLSVQTVPIDPPRSRCLDSIALASCGQVCGSWSFALFLSRPGCEPHGEHGSLSKSGKKHRP